MQWNLVQAAASFWKKIWSQQMDLSSRIIVPSIVNSMLKTTDGIKIFDIKETGP